jgi:hypothetical protein
VYWSHKYKNAGATSDVIHIQRLPKQKQLNYDVMCRLGCGQRIDHSSEPLNKRYDAIALVGGKNVIPTRLRCWGVECGLCHETYKNFVRNHHAVEGLVGAAKDCHSCGPRFTPDAIPRNLYGEDLRWVLDGDKAYEGGLAPTVAATAMESVKNREWTWREWFTL